MSANASDAIAAVPFSDGYAALGTALDLVVAPASQHMMHVLAARLARMIHRYASEAHFAVATLRDHRRMEHVETQL